MSAVLVLPLLAGCLSGESGQQSPADKPTAELKSQNTPPTISGTPPRAITIGQEYVFRPDTKDPDSDPLTFTIENRPSWASFNVKTGRLWGTPTLGDVGTYANILIRVSDSKESSSLSAFSIAVNNTKPGPQNAAPSISGTPPRAITTGQEYVFQPDAKDPDSDPLTFAIKNRPSWASFNAKTGRLWGTPTLGDTGTYANILISVSDGKQSSSLPAFSIAVASSALGSLTVSWEAPTTNADGSALTDLSGFKIYYGTVRDRDTLNNVVTIDNPSVNRFVVENLAPGTYFVAASAFNSRGMESERSEVSESVID